VARYPISPTFRTWEFNVKASLEDIASAFVHHEFSVAYPYFSDDVTWSLVGSVRFDGPAAVQSHCAASSAYLESVTTTFVGFSVMRGPDYVVVESEATYAEPTYAEPTGRSSAVASSDVFRFRDGLISSISSYNIELPTK